jgi:hypothetical protein
LTNPYKGRVVTDYNLFTQKHMRTRTYRSHNIDITHDCVVADAPAPDVGSRYTFIPTHQLVSALQTRHWGFDGGTARKVRNPERQSSTHHVLRFSNPHLPQLEDGTRPQAVILNSHNGSGCFELSLGAFRVACANGLVVQSVNCGTVKLRHVGLTTSAVLDAADNLLSRAPEVFNRVADWSKIQLNYDQCVELARAGARLRWNPVEQKVDVEDILRPRRVNDVGGDLWRTFNRVQENLIRGGVCVSKFDEETNAFTIRRNACAIRNPLENLRINRGLWQIAEELAFNA